MSEYVELHAASAFSFLDGASLPEELAGLCSHFNIPAIAVLDRDGVYGSPRLHMAAKKAKIRAHIGAEVSGSDIRYPLLAESQQGYQNLCRLITHMKMRARKGEGSIEERELEEFARGLVCLTGGEHGPLTQAIRRGGLAEGRNQSNTYSAAASGLFPTKFEMTKIIPIVMMIILTT